jgi:hypothetical protein
VLPACINPTAQNARVDLRQRTAYSISGVREAIEQKQWDGANAEIERVAAVLDGERALIDSMTAELGYCARAEGERGDECPWPGSDIWVLYKGCRWRRKPAPG